MPLLIVRNDITRMKVDAIVNAANKSLLGGGGVDGCIHRAAGPELLEECRGLCGCETGEAKITNGYRLPAKFVIHTVGPVYRDGRHNEEMLLTACYRNSLVLAEQQGCESVAFPLISSGAYRYPKQEALRVAEQTIRSYLQETHSDITVYLVFFDQKAFQLSDELSREVREYIDDHYVAELKQKKWFVSNRERDLLAAREQAELSRKEKVPCTSQMKPYPAFEEAAFCLEKETAADADGEKYAVPLPKAAAVRKTEKYSLAPSVAKSEKAKSEKDGWGSTTLSFEPVQMREEAVCSSLSEYQLDESFQEMLLRLIDNSGMSDAECYKRANIDRRLFSKIRSNRSYQPKKHTVFSFAVALRLSLDETEELLEKAGFALSHSILQDVIVESFIVRRNYDIDLINQALFAHDQVLLGSA